MKIVTGNIFGGGMCNRLLLYAHCLAVSLENGYELFVVNDEQADKVLDTESNENSKIRLIFCNQFIWKVVKKVDKIRKRLLNGKEQSASKIMNKIDRSKSVFIRTYYFRNVPLLIKHQVEIRSNLIFKKEHREKAEQIISKIRTDYPTKKIVAVHLRKGDYRTWRNGSFFFEDEEYLERMLSLVNTQGRDIHFLLISDEDVDVEYFQRNLEPYATVSTAQGNQYEELMTLSYSDYIMGPQSTYSGMAAFLGNKPLYFLNREVNQIDFSMFSWEKLFREIFNGVKIK
ncbi:MAG: alpha-1,2-fucosyltransferase [Ruminococcus sp.]|nr:alpha-1,2-fucosyltransferase [Ruminococcus sp.]